MSIPFLTAKLLIPPVRSNSVLRGRLLRRLGSEIGAKLTAVIAPAGFGKTTLVTTWINSWRKQEASRAVAWLSLDENDNDLLNFLFYLVAALQTIDKEIGVTTSVVLNGTQSPSINTLLTPLLNDIANLPHQAILVLDDYHLIHNPDIHDSMNFLIEHLPPQLQLAIISREALPFPLPRLRVRDQVVEISVQDLRFTQDEAADFLRKVMKLELSADFVHILEQRTEGWIAGLQMAALSLRAQNRPGSGTIAQAVNAFGGKHRYVIDYLAEEVMSQQSDAVRDFLYQTAVLDRFNASLCNAVTGKTNAQTLLTQLEQANLFLVNLDDERQWYRYHHLFADYLQSRLSASALCQHHQKASEWYENHNLIPEAIKHAIAANDIAATERLIEQTAEEMASNGQLNLVLSWLNALPPAIIDQNSYFATMKGWILYLRGERHRGEYYADLAQTHLTDDASPVHQGTLLGFRAELANNRGDPVSAIQLASQAIEYLKGTDSFSHTTAYMLLAEAYRLTGDRMRAIQTFRQTIAMGRPRGHHLITGKSVWHLAILLYFQGQRLEALSLCKQALPDYLFADGQPTPVAGFVHVPLGVLYYEANDLARAREHLELGLELCQQLGILKYTLIGRYTLARIHFAQNDADSAFRILLTAQQIARQLGHVEEGQLVAAAAVDLYLRLGNVTAAAQWIKSADFPSKPDVDALANWVETHPERVSLSYARYLLAVMPARIDVVQAILDKLEERVVREERNGRLITMYILRFLLLTAVDQTAIAQDKLAHAIRLAAAERYSRSFLDENIPPSSLLTQKQVAPSFITSLLAEVGVADKPTTSNKSQNMLNGRELEIIQLVANGCTNKGIADELHLTTGTVKWYLNRVYRKLEVSNRTQAVAHAREQKLL